jgi:hypothetical protein
MAYKHEVKIKASAREMVPPLLIGLLGTIGVVALFFMDRSFVFLDMVFLLVVVAFCTLGYLQRFLRGFLAFWFLYVASGIAATFYNFISPYVGAPFGGVSNDLTRALSFVILLLAIWIALEAISRALFKDTSFPKFGILDNLGGAFTYLIVGILFVALMYNALGYAQGMRHPKIKLRPAFRQVITLHYTTQKIWFSRGKPLFYLYGLDL